MLYEDLKALRLHSAKLSQEQAALWLGYSLRHYQRLERDPNKANLSTVIAMQARCGYLHVPGWENIRIHNEQIHVPGLRPIPVTALKAWDYLHQIHADINRPKKPGQIELF